MKNLFWIPAFLILSLSCAKTDEQLLDSAKQSAKHYLTTGDCAKARKALTDIGHQGDDATYIKLLSGSYACEAGYGDLDLFTELGTLPSGDNQMLGALTQLSTSNETEADSDNYTSVMNAIDVVLDEGGSGQGRIDKYGEVKGTDLNFQALYLILTELGKFVQYYGNAGGGIKGNGGAGNDCFLTYTVQDAMDYVKFSGLTGACNDGDTGHADLPGPATATTTQRRLCEGIYLFNNMRDILASANFGSDTAFQSLSDFSDAIEAAIVAAEGADPGDRITTVKNIYTKEACANLALDDLEVWYAVVFETAFP